MVYDYCNLVMCIPTTCTLHVYLIISSNWYRRICTCIYIKIFTRNYNINIFSCNLFYRDQFRDFTMTPGGSQTNAENIGVLLTPLKWWCRRTNECLQIGIFKSICVFLNMCNFFFRFTLYLLYLLLCFATLHVC